MQREMDKKPSEDFEVREKGEAKRNGCEKLVYVEGNGC